MPQWAETSLAKQLQESNYRFSNYRKVQQWLAETLGIEAKYHAVYQMTCYRLKTKLSAGDRRQRICGMDSKIRIL